MRRFHFRHRVMLVLPVIACLAPCAAAPAASQVATGTESGDLEAARGLFAKNLDAIRRRDREAYLACYLHADTLARMNNLAACYSAVGEKDRALALNEEAYRLRREKLGPDHPSTLNSMANLAAIYGKEVIDSWPEAGLRAEQLSLEQFIEMWRRIRAMPVTAPELHPPAAER